MILFIYLELSHLKPEELHNFSQSLFVFLYLYYKFEISRKSGNRGPCPASVTLIVLYWIGLVLVGR